MRMHHRLFFRIFVVVAAVGLAIGCITVDAQSTPKRGRKYKAPPQTARIEVAVLRDSDGKPIENAAVIFHPMEGERDKGNMELKSNEDGKAIIDVLPVGDTVRLQIIAKGYKTYGWDYKVDKPRLAFEIRMKRPGEQYSIYKPHDESVENGGGAVNGKDGSANKPADKPDDSSKKSDDSKTPDNKPNPPQTN